MVHNAGSIKAELAATRAQYAKNVLWIVRKTIISGASKEADRLYIKNEVMRALAEEVNNYSIGKNMQEDIYLENVVNCLKKLRLKS